jgi:hypothetical protein
MKAGAEQTPRFENDDIRRTIMTNADDTTANIPAQPACCGTCDCSTCSCGCQCGECNCQASAE